MDLSSMQPTTSRSIGPSIRLSLKKGMSLIRGISFLRSSVVRCSFFVVRTFYIMSTNYETFAFPKCSLVSFKKAFLSVCTKRPFLMRFWRLTQLMSLSSIMLCLILNFPLRFLSIFCKPAKLSIELSVCIELLDYCVIVLMVDLFTDD